MYKTNTGKSKLDELFGDGTLFKVMENEELKQAALVVKEMGKKEVGRVNFCVSSSPAPVSGPILPLRTQSD